MLRPIATLLLFLQAATINPEDAAKNVGKQVTVEGVVVQVTHSAKSNTTFLNFCAPFPKHCFNAVVFESAQATFSDVASSEGKKVRVSGVVQLYQGKPEIVLTKHEQLVVAKNEFR
jgi:DNA/RNA endonuclease YhcR with UshA esterase domain